MIHCKLPRIELGTTGYEISRLGIGGFHQVEITADIVARVVDTFQELGGNYIETARGYGGGASEEKIGRVLEGRREQFVIASKSGNPTADGIRRDLEITLKNLKTDYIDFYFYHGVASEEKLNQIAGPGGAAEGLAKAKEEGLLRGGAGLSSHRPWVYDLAIDRLDLALILIWSNYLEDMYLPEISGGIIPHAREKGVGVTAMKPLGDGFLYRSVEDAMRWTLGSGPEVLVSGMNSPEHVRQAVATICKGAADEAEREEILKRAPELGRYACRQCGGCSEALMETFRLEGYVDRQMMDYLEHDPAHYALAKNLSGWFNLGDIGRERFEKAGHKPEEIIAAAKGVDCPYGIDVERKARLATAKLTEGDPNRV